jgi:addiction module HigA family antidote
MAGRLLNPIHPGQILAEDLADVGVSLDELAAATGAALQDIERIIEGSSAIDVEMALRLAAFFESSPQYWMNLQTQYEIEVTELREGARIRKRVRPLSAA